MSQRQQRSLETNAFSIENQNRLKNHSLVQQDLHGNPVKDNIFSRSNKRAGKQNSKEGGDIARIQASHYQYKLEKFFSIRQKKLLKKQAVTKSVKGNSPSLLDVMEQSKVPVFKSDIKENQMQSQSGRRPDLANLENSMSFGPVNNQKRVHKQEVP